MEGPTLGRDVGTWGEASPRQHDPGLPGVPEILEPLLSAFTTITLRELLTAAAEARRHGDHSAGALLEHDALLAVRLTAPQQPWGALA